MSSCYRTYRDIMADRRRLKMERCHPKCPGWIIAESDVRGTEIEACDDCNALGISNVRLTDDVCQGLPAARRALSEAIAPMPLEVYDLRYALHNIRAWLEYPKGIDPGNEAAREWAMLKIADLVDRALDE